MTYRGATYPWQCDHIGHMNIMWYVSKFDEANWNLFARVGITPSYLREARYGMAGVQQNITYKRELLAGDVIEVRSRILEVRERVIRFVHEMRNAERDEVAAICETQQFTSIEDAQVMCVSNSGAHESREVRGTIASAG